MKKETPEKDWVTWLSNPWRLKPIYLIPALVLVVVAAMLMGRLIWPDNFYMAPGQSFFALEGEPARFAARNEAAFGGILDMAEADSLTAEFGSTLERKIIYSASLELEVDSADQAQAFALGYIQDRGGFAAETRRIVGADDRVQISMVLRLPAAGFDSAVLDFAELGKVLDQNLQGQDITEQYYDLETRLNTKIQQENRYLEILATAVTVEEILQVERELERIRTEIESMQGTIRYYIDRTDLATITLLFKEPPKAIEQSPAFLATLKEIGHAFGRSLKELLLCAGYFAPWLLLILVGLAIIRLVRRRSKRR